MINRYLIGIIVAVCLAGCAEPPESTSATDRVTDAAPAPDLPSWQDGASRQRILDFVSRVNDEQSPDFVPVAERIAVFDNDGTLWSEQPAYFQLIFAMDRVRSTAAEHPEWRSRQPFKGVLDNDMAAVVASGEKGVLELVMASHAGMSTEEFASIVTEWLQTARHPQLDRPYTELVFQPMLELLDYLRDHGFKTWIVSGGGIEFMRPWTERVYGIPPEQVVGSSIRVDYSVTDGEPMLTRAAEIDFIDDKAGKPVGIHQFIGRRPIMAFGNSDGDQQMLQWTHAGAGARLAVLIRHTDTDREWAYDRESAIGRLDKALDEADEKDWLVVDMQRDWQSIYPPASN